MAKMTTANKSAGKPTKLIQKEFNKLEAAYAVFGDAIQEFQEQVDMTGTDVDLNKWSLSINIMIQHIKKQIL